MNSKRLEYLKGLAQENPDDPFVKYAMALEYVNEGPDRAIKLLSELCEEAPDYLPAYYQLAALLLDKGEHKTAEQIINKGVALAEKQGELKTRDELASLIHLY